jgi:hypothetical protein
MIVNKFTGYIIDTTEAVINVPEHIKKNMLNIDTDHWIFHVPNNIKNNHEKLIYKVGFLREFYKLLDPNLSYSDIYKKINKEWQVFKSERQMERLAKKYKMSNKKEEN